MAWDITPDQAGVTVRTLPVKKVTEVASSNTQERQIKFYC